MLEHDVTNFIECGANPQALNSLLQRCMDDGGPRALSHVSRLFEDDYGGMTYKWELKEPSGAALLYWRETGIDELARVARRSVRFANRGIAFDILSSAASGEFSMLLSGKSWLQLKQKVIDRGALTTEMQKYAQRTLVELALNIEDEDDLILALANSFQRHYANPKGGSAAKQMVQAAASRWFAIGDHTLSKYLKLIEDSPNCEPSFQAFFEANPQLLDPMAVEVWPEPNLFGSRKPDFVVKRSDGSYLVIEIECPKKMLVTKAGNLSAAASHAENQAMDYRSYMMQHISSVRETFPTFSDPDCLVIVGLESSLTDGQKSALFRHNAHRHRLDVVGFDWILDRARRISENVAEHGVIVSVTRMT